MEQTRVIKDSLSPKWDEAFIVSFDSNEMAVLKVEIDDQDDGPKRVINTRISTTLKDRLLIHL